MEAWLNQVAPQLLKDISIYAYGLVFLAGLVSSIGPCNITMVPIFFTGQVPLMAKGPN